MRERPNTIDRMISRNIRLHRLARGMTQAALGAALGISFQQVQKYEGGGNRVSSSRLLQIAQVLKVDVRALLGVTNSAGDFPSAESSPVDLIAEPQSLRLATIFASIDDADLRRSLLVIAGRLASVSQRGSKRR